MTVVDSHRTGVRLGRALVALGATLGLGLGLAGPAHAVAKGERVPEGTYRFATQLTMPNIVRPDGTSYSSACSAALIAPQWIVSAGHCFHDGARNPISGPVHYPVIATVGTADLDSGHGVSVDVLEIFQAPDRDLALGRLAHPVEEIEPLALNDQPLAIDETVHIAGWGWTGEGEAAPGRLLYTGKFAVVEVVEDIVYVNGFAPEVDTSACAWDSGAPFFVIRYGVPHLVSIEDDGPECPHDDREMTSRIDNVVGWINGVVDSYDPGGPGTGS